jgi:3-polyprenyl-4-hydroxybenzoate decarboxylase
MRKDLRTFLAAYEKDHPEDVIRGEKQIDSAYECTAIARHFEKLNKFPLVIFYDILTAGMFTCYDPDTGMENTAFHRGFVAGPREIRSLLTPFTHAAYNLKKHEERGIPMKVAYWVGHHPAVIMGAQTRIGYPESHYAAAGGVALEPLRLVPSETLGDDFLILADAEFVIEGMMPPGKRDLEGPFGEYPRYSGPQQMSPVFEVIVVDEDIDIYDDRWVLWAVATRSQWDRDLAVVPGCRGAKLDPSIDGTTTTKGGIDATRPAPPARFSEKLYMPEEVMKSIRLADFMDEEKINGAPTAADR